MARILPSDKRERAVQVGEGRAAGRPQRAGPHRIRVPSP